MSFPSPPQKEVINARTYGFLVYGQVSVYGEGVYAAVAVSLPKDTSLDPWGEAITEEPGQVYGSLGHLLLHPLLLAYPLVCGRVALVTV